MYVAVKGGEAAIDAAHKLLAHERRGDGAVPEISADQIREQLTLAVNRVMAEGSLYDPDLAALAIKQARGDLIEAIFIARAFRTTLPRFGFSETMDTGAMAIQRRISATYKDLPGGQVLGPTFDYTHRLLDHALNGESTPATPERAAPGDDRAAPHVTALLNQEGLIEPSSHPEPGGRHEPDAAVSEAAPVADLTRGALDFPAGRDLRLQALARGDEGFLLGLGYSTQRGYGRTHPFAGEIRMGEVEVFLVPEELGFAVPLGEVTLTECEMVNQFKGSAEAPPQFTRGYGLVFGHSERKAMSMALVDRALRAEELGEERIGPAQDEEFVLSHADNVQATGFVEHLKLPHYVDFQAELALVRQLRAEWAAERSGPSPTAEPEAAE
jgi:alpha-D-ribose 1-methylphosphonate 5-triphosphate synthase subunit PhnI